MQKKVDWPKIRLIIKNPQFLHNQADIQAILPTHELVIFTKFHNNWIEIEDFFNSLIFGQSSFLQHSLVSKGDRSGHTLPQ